MVHLKDKPYTTASDLLKAICLHNEAESNLWDRGFYSSYKLKYDTNGKATDKYTKKTDGY